MKEKQQQKNNITPLWPLMLDMFSYYYSDIR